VARRLECSGGVTTRLILQRSGGAPERIAFAAGATAGSGPGDAIAVAELPAAALAFTPSPHGALVEVRAGAARVGDRALATGAVRLLRPGEAVVAGAVALGPEPAAAAERTRCLAAGVLAEAQAGAAPVVGPRLLVVEGRDAGLSIAVREGIIGRGSGAELRLSDARASRRHAALFLRDGRPALRDLGSKNGLAVNGRRPRRAVALAPGDVVQIGNTLLAYEEGAAERASAAAAARAATAGPKTRARAARTAVACGALVAIAAALCLAAAAG
jgi:hypothetical protein